MYQPPAFAVDDDGEALEMARSIGFGHLVAHGADGLVSTPVPFLIDGDGLVRAHLARANPILSLAPTDALLVVPGLDAYVSPGWYPSKREHGRAVPTWNYEVVHLHGRLQTHATDWTEQLVRDLSDHHERAMPAPWSVDDAPDDFVERQLRAIVGISLEVGRVEAKRKLGQNRSGEDAAGVVAGLESTGHDSIAAAVRARHPDLDRA